MLRACTRCYIDKPESDYAQRVGKPGIMRWCKQCHYDYKTEWNRKNKDRHKAYQIKARFGLTPERHAKLLADHTGCAMCGTDQNLAIDHCHKTGEVRGMLCRTCNVQLGAYEAVKERAAAYLARTIRY